MRNTLLIVLAIAACLGLSACRDKMEPTTPSTNPAATTTPTHAPTVTTPPSTAPSTAPSSEPSVAPSDANTIPGEGTVPGDGMMPGDTESTDPLPNARRGNPRGIN